jgi:hypothetical protein
MDIANECRQAVAQQALIQAAEAQANNETSSIIDCHIDDAFMDLTSPGDMGEGFNDPFSSPMGTDEVTETSTPMGPLQQAADDLVIIYPLKTLVEVQQQSIKKRIIKKRASINMQPSKIYT